MKEEFIPKRFQQRSIEIIRTANEIVDNYLAQGLKLTLRQLYYQFVARHGLPNTEKSYKNLAGIISDARLAGMIDWDAIEDRGRKPDSPSEFVDLKHLTDAALRSYRLDRWSDQDFYVELWVEKQALAGVLWPLASRFHVTLMVNKGYSSQSAMYEASKRFIENGSDRESIIFYIGDHDPSGEDMVRDIQDRMTMFGANVDVQKLALTMDQVKQYDPPPNPAKSSDARYEQYVAKHGDESWEVDALDPATLSEIIRDALEFVVDNEKMQAVIDREDRDKELLRKAVAKLTKR